MTEVGAIFIESSATTVSPLTRSEHTLAIKTHGVVGKSVEDLQPPHPGHITRRWPAKAEPRQIWPGRQIHDHRPSHSR